MTRKVIWSTHEEFVYVDILKKEHKIDKDLKTEEIEELLQKYKKKNIDFLRNFVVTKFNKETKDNIVAFAYIYDDSKVRKQMAVEVGKNYKSIFDFDYDKATWFVDGWNIKAEIDHNNIRYVYTFRTLKDNTKKNEIIKRINSGSPMLTGTFLGHNTRTILKK